MVLCQLCIPGNQRGLQALGDEGCVDAAGALYMDALQALVDVCQHLGAQCSVAGLGLEGIQLPEGEGVQRARGGRLPGVEVEGPGPEQVPNLPKTAIDVAQGSRSRSLFCMFCLQLGVVPQSTPNIKNTQGPKKNAVGHTCNPVTIVGFWPQPVADSGGAASGFVQLTSMLLQEYFLLFCPSALR